MAPMAQPSHLGIGASCTIKLCFLHPKNKVKEKILNQALQQLGGLIVQGHQEKTSDDRTRSVSYFNMRILVDSMSGLFNAMCL